MKGVGIENPTEKDLKDTRDKLKEMVLQEIDKCDSAIFFCNRKGILQMSVAGNLFAIIDIVEEMDEAIIELKRSIIRHTEHMPKHGEK